MTETVARWRIIGFYVVFAAFLVGAAVALIVALMTDDHPVTRVAIPALFGLVLGIVLVLVPTSVRTPQWVFTLALAVAAFVGPFLHGTYGAVALSFGASTMLVLSAALLTRRERFGSAVRRHY